MPDKGNNQTFLGQSGHVRRAAFTPDGRRLVVFANALHGSAI